MLDGSRFIYTFNAGYSNIKTKRKLKLIDKFCLGSSSKNFLTLAITILSHKNLEYANFWNLTLNEIILKYFNFEIHETYKNVTMRQLANHTSGLPGNKILFEKCPKFYKKIRAYKSPLSTAKFILKHQSFNFPGTKFEYSNIGYAILGIIIEKMTNKNYVDLIKEYVLSPLNLPCENFGYMADIGFAEGHKYEYYKQNPEFKPLKENEHYESKFEEPAGRFYLSVEESVLYLQEYLKVLNGKPSVILTKEVLQDMFKVGLNEYGLGWYVNDKEIYHGGLYYMTQTMYCLIRDKNIGIVVNSNCSNSPGEGTNFNQISTYFVKLFGYK